MSITGLILNDIEHLKTLIKEYSDRIQLLYLDLMKQDISMVNQRDIKEKISFLEKEKKNLEDKLIKIIYSNSDYSNPDLYFAVRLNIPYPYAEDLDNFMTYGQIDKFHWHELKDNEIPDIEIVLSQVINKIKHEKSVQGSLGLNADAVIKELTKLNDKIINPELRTSDKLKLSIPIIPFLLYYEKELSLDLKVNLRLLWNKITGKKQ